MTYLTLSASILLFIGLYLIGNKLKIGFVFSFLGEVIWTFEAFRREMYDLAIVCIVFGLMAIINYYKWNKKQE